METLPAVDKDQAAVVSGDVRRVRLSTDLSTCVIKETLNLFLCDSEVMHF